MATTANRKFPWLAIRHVEHEHIGTLAKVLEGAQVGYRYLDVFRGDRLPGDLAGVSGLIVMGGPMGVYEADRHPFLTEEQALIRHAADSDLPVLGICLGAQLIAAALGARIYPGGKKEIGWYAVAAEAPEDEWVRDLPASFMAFHWHGDTFDLPAGAVRLFRSQLYPNQGFRWGRKVCGIQFHFEINTAMIDDWLQDGGCRAELASVPDISPETIRQQTREHVAQLEGLCGKLFTRFLTTVTSG